MILIKSSQPKSLGDGFRELTASGIACYFQLRLFVVLFHLAAVAIG